MVQDFPINFWQAISCVQAKFVLHHSQSQSAEHHGEVQPKQEEEEVTPHFASLQCVGMREMQVWAQNAGDPGGGEINNIPLF